MPRTPQHFSQTSKQDKSLEICPDTSLHYHILQVPERSGKPNSVIIAAAVGLKQLRDKFGIHLEQMSPTFIAIEQNLKPHGVENQEINTSKPHIYFSLNGTYATLMMQQERK